jgi:hypothetical protein
VGEIADAKGDRDRLPAIAAQHQDGKRDEKRADQQ